MGTQEHPAFLGKDLLHLNHKMVSRQACICMTKAIAQRLPGALLRSPGFALHRFGNCSPAQVVPGLHSHPGDKSHIVRSAAAASTCSLCRCFPGPRGSGSGPAAVAEDMIRVSFQGHGHHPEHSGDREISPGPPEGLVHAAWW
jgi:hypothetical protein